MRSVARRVLAAGVASLAAALLLVGAVTGALLHLREVAALDRALLAAAHARARPEGPGAWQVEHEPPDLETWVVAEGDERIPPRIRARAAAGTAPLIKDQGDRRLVLLPARDPDGAPIVVAAMAPRVTPARSVGAFAAIWLGTSTVAVGVAALGIAGAVRLAFRPIGRARDEVARVVAFGQRQRVSTDAPPEVRPLLEALNALLDRLEAAHALQVRFTAEAAHELRTPVTALLGELDVALRRERCAAELRDALVAARGDAARLQRLVEAMTALARVDAGEIEAHREPVRAGELAREALEAEGSALAAAGCRVTLHLDDDPELEVSRVLLALAVGNLLRNAAKHAPGAEVRLTVRAEADRCVFEVRDDGPGVPPELGDRAFERFSRGGEARRADPTGLGLGLPLAREVARRHGGDCVLRPVVGGGTRAVLTVAHGR